MCCPIRKTIFFWGHGDILSFKYCFALILTERLTLIWYKNWYKSYIDPVLFCLRMRSTQKSGISCSANLPLHSVFTLYPVSSQMALIPVLFLQVALSSTFKAQLCSLQGLRPGLARATSLPLQHRAKPQLRFQGIWLTWLARSLCSRIRHRAAPPRASAAAPRWGRGGRAGLRDWMLNLKGVIS